MALSDRTAQQLAKRQGGPVNTQPVASWSVRGFRVFFPIATIQDSGGNRLVERERAYRDGAKFDDTYSKARRWTFVVLFANAIEEQGLEGNGGIPLYPGVMQAMKASFGVHEVGDLTLPAEGPVRARAQSWDGGETPDERDDDGMPCARVTFTFVEDNEDNVDATSIKPPTATANAKRLAETTKFSADSVDAGHFSVSQLVEAVSELEGIANAPFDMHEDMEVAAKRIGDLAVQARQALGIPGRRGRDQLTKSSGARTEAKLARSHDMAASSAAESRRGRPRIIRVEVLLDTSLFALCAALQQDLMVLSEINPQLESGFYIPAGTEVRILAGTGAIP